MRDLFYVQTRVEEEKMRRIKLSVAAYAYEKQNDIIMLDAQYDAESRKVDLKIKTGNRKMDDFFTKHFNPSTGSWIGSHPEIAGIRDIYLRYFTRGAY